MSFERHGEIYPNDKGADPKADAPAHHSDEFPAGYSLTGCSPALPISASPAGVEYAFRSAQLRGFLTTQHVGQNQTEIMGGGYTLVDPVFCPNNGVHLKETQKDLGAGLLHSMNLIGQISD
jgi:hypothetical protein